MSPRLAFLARHGKLRLPTLPDILHIKQPSYPQFRFEWHTKTKRVYLIRMGVEPLIGEPIAFDIENQGAAHNAVLIWLRGYREGCAPRIGEPQERKVVSNEVQSIDREIAALVTKRRTETEQ